MSGTSLDGIDVAVVEMPRIRTLAFRSTPYPETIRTQLLALAKTGVESVAAVVERISRLNYQLAELYAKAIRRIGPVELIGCHGQTVYRSEERRVGKECRS